MKRVRLETADGKFVFDGEILPFLPIGNLSPWPRVLIWGERFFMIHDEAPPATYREVFVASVFDPKRGAS